MISEEKVRQFLKQFKEHKRVFGIIFRDDRGKNMQSLADLEISGKFREAIIDELKVTDFSEGPLEEKLFGGAEMWVFGKRVKDQEVYIKISMIHANSKVICISFHVAEFPMFYPFKK